MPGDGQSPVGCEQEDSRILDEGAFCMRSGSLFARATVVLTTMFIAGGFASGDIVNGSFDTGTTYGWMVLAGANSSYSVVDITESDNVLKMDTIADYSGGTPPLSYVTAAQPDIFSTPFLYAPSGTTAIEFNAKAVVAGVTWPTIDVQVSYTDLLNTFRTASCVITESDADWRLRTITLSDIDTTKSLSFQVRVIANHQPDGDLATATGYFDDFAFVPEPATVTLLSLGGIAILRRRRRQS